jgi:ABC-type multidrug transport system ATPase subunit
VVTLGLAAQLLKRPDVLLLDEPTASLDPDAQEQLRDEFRRRLGDPQGAFTLSARAWCAVGSAP